MINLWVYASLFFVALLAATLLPLQSEALLIGLVLTDSQPISLLIIVATLGNVLGSTINWYLGRKLEQFSNRSWFPIKHETLVRAEVWYHKYGGKWSLLLSWMPVIGDPITMIAGIMRVPLWLFLTIVTTAKLARYCVLVAITLGLFS
ncbi:YqaA family protein [Entomomonas asaccharolytica]|uniref:DedA family protein n=1 Tax=Entomomonas asaccharolytica TaxID=2785331 RepID=A0A974ND90_9GAMM|nr:YqaA family protein [Entomomonas asaccharolytica]QQP84600.1 DedA family protein [Entomomonas asaccharolytica]